MIDIKKINSLDKSEFLSIFGNVFDKSKWIIVSIKPHIRGDFCLWTFRTTGL